MNEMPQPNPIKNEFRQLVPVYALGLVIAYFASMQFVTQIITPEAIIKGSADADHYLYKGVLYNCFIWIVLLGYCYKYMPFKSTEQINVKRVFLNIIFGYLACIGVMFAIGLIYQFIGFEPETQAVAERIKNASSTNIYLIILGPALFVPLTEELIFRAYIYRGFKFMLSADGELNNKFSKASIIAMVFASLLFSLVHFEVEVMPQLFLLGLVFNIFYERSNSLAVCTCLHAMNNTIAILMLFFAV